MTTKAATEPPVDIFTAASEKSTAASVVQQELSTFGTLNADPETYAELLESAPEEWTLNLPITSVTPRGLALRLTRQTIAREDVRVRLASTGAFLPTANLGFHYAGEVVGEPGSRVAFSLLDGEMMGTIDRPHGERLAIGRVQNYTKDASEPDAYVIFPDAQLAEREELNCATPDNGGNYDAKELEVDPNQKNSVGCVDIYLEVDFDIVINKGGVDGASQYVAALFNQVHTLYEAINVDVFISEMFVWDEPSPYGGTTSIDYLYGFQGYRTSFNGDLAHLVSYGASGGVAILNGLCHFRTSNKMSFASIRSSYQNVPTYSWSVMVVAHEIGHQLGSQHTHACVWNGNGTAIDGCAGGTEGSCPNPGYPSGGGTIMSYCHLRNVGINFTEGFGAQPGALIQNRVANAQGCLANDCSSGNDGNDPNSGGGDNGGGGNGGGGDNGGGGGGDNGGGGDGGDPDCPGGREVSFRLTLDDFGAETSWRVVSEQGLVMQTGGPYGKKQKGVSYTRTFCLPDGCYLLEVMDSDGDGICCGYGNGYYELTNLDNEILASGDGEFESLSTRDFCVDADGGSGGDGDNDGDDNDVDCPGFDFNYYRPQTYGTNQDAGTFEVQDTGSTIYLENNAWKAIRYPYTVTSDTWISFWFKSTRQGEVHGIGFDNNQVISSGFTFRLHGTQRWGISSYDNYPGDGEWKYYEINIGRHYTGNAEWLFFTADHDIGSSNGNSYFRSVTVTEGMPCNNAANLQSLDVAPEADAVSELQLNPNPANAEIRVNLPGAEGMTSYRVLDINGRTVLRGKLPREGVRISTAQLPSGAYILRTGAGEAKRFTVSH